MQSPWTGSSILDALPQLVGLSGALVSIAAALGGLIAGRAAARLHKIELTVGPLAVARAVTPLAAGPPSPQELERELRVAEAKAIQRRQEGASKWFRRMSGALSGGQYLVGAALTSGFIQSSLSPALVGFLGLIVLLSQATRHAYRPDLRAVGAAQRAFRLKEVIRSVEDDLYETGPQPPQSTLHKLRRRITRALAEAERLEAEELATRLRPLEPETPEPQRLPPSSGPPPAA